MTRLELKTLAKSQIRGNILTLFLCYLVIFAINVPLAFIPILGGIVSGVLSPVFSMGVFLIFLNLIDGNAPCVGDVFGGFRIFGKAFFLNLVMAIFIALWSLLLIIPGIIKGFSYSMAFYILAENPEMSVFEALTESRRLMDGHKMEFFVLNLSFIGWILLTAITFGIAGIYVNPYIFATNTNFYRYLKNNSVEKEALA